jgi:hypothetical protein
MISIFSSLKRNHKRISPLSYPYKEDGQTSGKGKITKLMNGFSKNIISHTASVIEAMKKTQRVIRNFDTFCNR